MYEIIFTLILLTLGYFVGSHVERKHYASIIKREAEFKDILLFDNRLIPPGLNAQGGEIVLGHVVISVDYFKRFVAGLRKIFGGRLKTYETLMDRGRREAILRMKAKARELDATMIINIKFETASISKGAKNTIGSVEVYVYGSAISTQTSA